jgi:hypothetical protein
MKKILTLLACLLFLSFGTYKEVMAQKKPKNDNKAFAKQLIGKWILEDFDAKIDETKATPEQKEQMNAMIPNMRKEFLEAKGKTDSGYFIFQKDNTYLTRSPESTDDRAGKWQIKNGEVFLIPDSGSDKFQGKMAGKFLRLTSTSEDMPMMMIVIFKKN